MKRVPVIRVRIVLDTGVAFGPGKADLLAAIETHGSIAAAGRSMRMSYQRAWSLIDELNGMFRDPLVVLSRGGAQRGGAALTDAGKAILARYRAIEATTADACAGELAGMTGMLKRQESDISTHR